MSTCRVCMAPITWALSLAGHRVPLDDHEQHDEGPHRYRIVTDGAMPVVAPVGEDQPGRLHVDHREICQQPRAL